MKSFEKLLSFLSALKSKNIFFDLQHIRDETILVYVVVPGQRWEVEFFVDGSIEIERFIAEPDGIHDESILEELWKEFSD